MKTQLINQGFYSTPKATINKHGYLSFNFPASQLLNLDFQRYLRVAIQEGKDDGSILYLIPEKHTPRVTFKVGRTEGSYFVNLKRFFLSFQLDFIDRVISYTFHNVGYGGNKIWMLRKSEQEPRREGADFHTVD